MLRTVPLTRQEGLVILQFIPVSCPEGRSMPASSSKLSSSSFRISRDPNASVYTWPGGTATAKVLSLELSARLAIRHEFLNLRTYDSVETRSTNVMAVFSSWWTSRCTVL